MKKKTENVNTEKFTYNAKQLISRTPKFHFDSSSKNRNVLMIFICQENPFV